MPGINPMMITPQMHAEIMRRLAQQGMVDYQPYDPTSDYQNLGQTYLQGLQGANQAAQAPVSTSFRDIAPAGLGVILAALGNAVSKGQYPNLPIQIGQTADNRYQQRLQERGQKAQGLATQAEAQYNVGLQGIRSKQQASENQLQARKAVLDYLADLAKTQAQQEHWGAMEKRLGQGGQRPLTPAEERARRAEYARVKEEGGKKGGTKGEEAKSDLYEYILRQYPKYLYVAPGGRGYSPSVETIGKSLGGPPFTATKDKPGWFTGDTTVSDTMLPGLLDAISKARQDSSGIQQGYIQDYYGGQSPVFMPGQQEMGVGYTKDDLDLMMAVGLIDQAEYEQKLIELNGTR